MSTENVLFKYRTLCICVGKFSRDRTFDPIFLKFGMKGNCKIISLNIVQDEFLNDPPLLSLQLLMIQNTINGIRAIINWKQIYRKGLF